MKRRAVITGLGPITCIGKGKELLARHPGGKKRDQPNFHI